MLIYPSIFEGFGIPILEALFSKIPVITSKDSCFEEAGGEDSIYIDPLSSEEITKAINIFNGTGRISFAFSNHCLLYTSPSPRDS